MFTPKVERLANLDIEESDDDDDGRDEESVDP